MCTDFGDSDDSANIRLSVGTVGTDTILLELMGAAYTPTSVVVCRQMVKKKNSLQRTGKIRVEDINKFCSVLTSVGCVRADEYNVTINALKPICKRCHCAFQTTGINS
ncbi:hypothetical protein F2P81_007443 [Scophthalmus maximus]|uniref:Uncharacterized protein n=1 Tax=Scophthalmus maximus TaxID=52904 RepID=A0A6A4T4E1_SCOMX|nr:hypothetical protein F2P81_007443 [Scophthalmus maximus]